MKNLVERAGAYAETVDTKLLVTPRVILCHCRYCQTLTGSALSTNVWFPEEKVSLLKGDLSSYEMKTESGNVVTTNFCKNCGSTVFLRLNVLYQCIDIQYQDSFFLRDLWQF